MKREIISKFVGIGVLVSLIFVMASCSVIKKESFRKTVYFDINAPEQIGQAAGRMPVKIMRFSSNCPEIGNHMAFASANGAIAFDEYHRWAQQPERMLERYFNLYFNSSSEGKYSIDAILYGLTADIDRNRVRLILKVTIENNAEAADSWSGVIVKDVPLRERSAVNFSEAAAQAANQVAEAVAAKLQEVAK